MKTSTDLAALPMAELVAIHNLLAAPATVTMKTFSQRSKAVDRIVKVASDKGISLDRLHLTDGSGWAIAEEKPAETKPQGGELQAAIEAGIKGGNDPASQTAAPEAPAKPKRKAKEKSAEAKPKGPSIRSVAETLLLQVVGHDEDKRPVGRTYEDILNELREKFPGCKTSVACLRWYAVHMRERDVKVPTRPRAVPEKSEAAIAASEAAAKAG